MNHRVALWSFAVCLSFSLGCDGPKSQPATNPPADAEEPVGDEPAAAPEQWADATTLDEQVAFMAAKVVPEMKPIFQAGNAEHYADFGCPTCHGPDKLPPTQFLPHLTMKDGQLVEMTEKKEISEFMATKIVPPMAALLGQEPYNPQTQTGFGCGGCHTIDMQ